MGAVCFGCTAQRDGDVAMVAIETRQLILSLGKKMKTSSVPAQVQVILFKKFIDWSNVQIVCVCVFKLKVSTFLT